MLTENAGLENEGPSKQRLYSITEKNTQHDTSIQRQQRQSAREARLPT